MTVDMYNQSAFLVIKIAYMYYIENYCQNEIAKALQISVTTVSRMLKKAKQERIVEFVIRDPYVECISLEKELKETFGLKDVIIAPGLAVEAEDGNYLGDEESAKKLVALEGARYLQRIIKKNDVLGITLPALDKFDQNIWIKLGSDASIESILNDNISNSFNLEIIKGLLKAAGADLTEQLTVPPVGEGTIKIAYIGDKDYKPSEKEFSFLKYFICPDTIR